MKKLKNEELVYECSRLQLKGKCAVLLNSNNNDYYTCDKVLLTEMLISDGVGRITVFDNFNFKQVEGVLINFTMHSNFSFFKIENIMNELVADIPEHVNIVFTASYTESMSEKRVDVTIILDKRKTCFISTIITNTEKLIKPFQKYFRKFM